MDTLGGKETLRGFQQFRFRDARLLYLSAEYRWEAAPAIEGVLFYDTGKVFPESDRIEFDHLEHNIGAGIRFKAMNRVILRLDVGRGREGTVVHFQTENHPIQCLEPDAGTNVVLQVIEFNSVTFRKDLSGIVK